MWRKGEIESSAATWLPFGPNPATVTLHNVLYCSQADPDPLEFRSSVQALKRREEPGCTSHFKTGAIVADDKLPLTLPFCRGEFNASKRFPSGKLPGVAEQVLHH